MGHKSSFAQVACRYLDFSPSNVLDDWDIDPFAVHEPEESAYERYVEKVAQFMARQAEVYAMPQDTPMQRRTRDAEIVILGGEQNALKQRWFEMRNLQEIDLPTADEANSRFYGHRRWAMDGPVGHMMDLPYGCDHTTFAMGDDTGYRGEMLFCVTQPYEAAFDSTGADEYAQRHGIEYQILPEPAWHNDGCHLIVWHMDRNLLAQELDRAAQRGLAVDQYFC